MRRASLTTRLALLTGACVALPTLFACLDHPLKPVQYEAAQEQMMGIQLTINKDVDVLFVIDNSGSMGDKQDNVAANFGAFIGVLEAPDVKANYRLGITTVDNGNPICQGTGPEAGKLVLSSCLSRLPDFIFNGAMMVDSQTACTNNCTLKTIDVTPTTTSGDPKPTPRPWMENIEGQTNLPSGVSTLDAFKCFGPQGINGCGMEAPLESMYKAILRSSKAGEASAGFIRDTAILSIVILTDEADCSYNPDHQSIFLSSGAETFWTNKGDPTPTSAVCWNAGVECTGGPGTYDDCHSANYDEMGNKVPDAQADAGAVLHPVQRYIDLVQSYETMKQTYYPDQQVLVAGITGVPTGYSAGTADLVYQDAPQGTPHDANWQQDFGIGPGCTAANYEAVPPVRIREFAEAFEVNQKPNLFSICSDDFSPALKAIADAIRDQIKPACMTTCVADTDPTTPIVDPKCALTQSSPDGSGGFNKTDVPQCAAVDGTLPKGADVCFVALVDKNNLTPAKGDDMSQTCIDQGWNLEFKVFRRQGVAAPAGTSVTATCSLSQNKAMDCPDLP